MHAMDACEIHSHLLVSSQQACDPIGLDVALFFDSCKHGFCTTAEGPLERKWPHLTMHSVPTPSTQFINPDAKGPVELERPHLTMNSVPQFINPDAITLKDPWNETNSDYSDEFPENDEGNIGGLQRWDNTHDKLHAQHQVFDGVKAFTEAGIHHNDDAVPRSHSGAYCFVATIREGINCGNRQRHRARMRVHIVSPRERS
jgi:hypothetical protein